MGQDGAGRINPMMPCVVQEIVVPIVHEAFSVREMSEEPPGTDSDESPSAIEMEDIPTARVQEGPGPENVHPGASEKNPFTIGTTYSVLDGCLFHFLTFTRCFILFVFV